MLGISEAAASVVVGALALVGVVATGLLARSGKRAASEARTNIGVPNGHGTVVQMLETVIRHQGEQDAKLTAHVDATTEAFDRFDRRMARLEHAHNIEGDHP